VLRTRDWISDGVRDLEGWELDGGLRWRMVVKRKQERKRADE